MLEHSISYTEWAKNYLVSLLKYCENTRSHTDMKSLTLYAVALQLLLQELNVSSFDYAAYVSVIAYILPCLLYHM
jgi:hypothetical protein